MNGRGLADLAAAWMAASVLSGIPSTVHAVLAGRDAFEATRAAGAMLASTDAPRLRLLVAAAVVHGTVSLFWAAVLWRTLPRSHVLPAALLASVGIGLLDLRVIAPRRFPEVAALPFWPQMADHAIWGACLGAALAWRWRRRTSPAANAAP